MRDQLIPKELLSRMQESWRTPVLYNPRYVLRLSSAYLNQTCGPNSASELLEKRGYFLHIMGQRAFAKGHHRDAAVYFKRAEKAFFKALLWYEGHERKKMHMKWWKADDASERDDLHFDLSIASQRATELRRIVIICFAKYVAEKSVFLRPPPDTGWDMSFTDEHAKKQIEYDIYLERTKSVGRQLNEFFFEKELVEKKYQLSDHPNYYI